MLVNQSVTYVGELDPFIYHRDHREHRDEIETLELLSNHLIELLRSTEVLFRCF